MKDDNTNIIDNEMMAKIKKIIEKILFFNDWQNAYKFVRKFEPLIVSNSLKIPAQFKDELTIFVIQGKWIALPILKDEEVIDLFKHHFIVQYDLLGGYYDIWDKLRSKLINIPMYTDRDNFRQKIKNIILNNEELIVDKGPIGEAKKKVRPTIKNWLVDYKKVLGTGEKNAVMINNYIIQHSVISGLSEEEKNKLKELFNFYELVKVSSLDPKGHEETIPVYHEQWGQGTMIGGKFVPVKGGDIESMGELIEDMKKWNEQEVGAGDSIISSAGQKNKRIEEMEGAQLQGALQQKFEKFLATPMVVGAFEKGDELQKGIGGDLKELRNKFYHAVNDGVVEDALSALFVIVENGKMRKAFAEDDRFVKFWGGYLDKYGLDSDRFKNDPANAGDMAGFLRYILEKRLKMESGQAVLTGMVISNLARHADELEYQEMVYGDEETGEFEWRV